MPMDRGEIPAVLRDEATFRERYLDRLEKARLEKRTKPAFRWPIRNGLPINRALAARLEEMAGNHCNYCDGYPLKTTSRQTIDHFRPKERFPALAFRWDNLFLACDRCQQVKRDRFDEDLLKPDTPGYRFWDFFVFNFRTGEIDIKPGLTDRRRRFAATTLSLLELNDPYLTSWRLALINHYRASETPGRERPYRYMWL